jgi:serine/threonine protein kinase
MLNTNDVLQKRYRIVRRLGQGGMGAVYEAIDERFGEPIALKEVLLAVADVAPHGQLDMMTKAFEREAKSLAKAKHEAVPYVRDYFFELDRQYLVMELVEGDDLARLLAKRNAPFPLYDVINWMDQLLDALDYLHNLNPPIIHRDIKPQNLKLNFRRKIKLLDFGIAKSVDNSAFTITNQTFVGATLNYSPIEQILRVMNATFREFILLKHREETEKILHQNSDARSDIYALGATFYHLLTNHPPVDVVKRTLDVWEKHIDPLPSPSELNPEIPAALSDCLVKALQIERDNRYSTAAEMHKAVHAAVAGVDRFVFGYSLSHLPKEASPRPEKKQETLANAMQAETDVLLDWDANKTFIDTPRSPGRPDPGPSPLTAPAMLTVPPPEATDTSLGYVKDSDPSVWRSVPEPARPDAPALRGSTMPEAASDSVPKLPFTFGNTIPRARLYLILPVAAIALMIPVGFGALVLLMRTPGPPTPEPAANVALPTPAAAAVAEQQNVQSMPEPEASPGANIAQPSLEPSKPQPAAVPKRTPSAVPVPRQAATPKQQKRKELTDDCLFNNNCG